MRGVLWFIRSRLFWLGPHPITSTWAQFFSLLLLCCVKYLDILLMLLLIDKIHMIFCVLGLENEIHVRQAIYCWVRPLVFVLKVLRQGLSKLYRLTFNYPTIAQTGLEWPVLNLQVVRITGLHQAENWKFLNNIIWHVLSSLSIAGILLLFVVWIMISFLKPSVVPVG